MLTSRRPRPLPSFPLIPLFAALLAAATAYFPARSAAQGTPTPQKLATVRHALSLNGRIEGTVQQLNGEAVTFNSSAVLTGDFLVPGTPTVQLNGTPNWQGRQTGTGSTAPAGWQLTLSGGATLRYLVNRTDPVALPQVTVPPSPAGTRNVTLNSPADAQAVGNWATVKDLTLNSGAGDVTVPAGTYGNLNASNSNQTGFVFGVAGASTPSVYNLQALTINSGARLTVVGPVVITVRNQVSVAGNAALGSSAHPEWLTLNVSSSGVTVNSGGTLYGTVLAPAGRVSLDGRLVGTTASDQLTVNSGAVLAAAPASQPTNQAPVVSAGANQTILLPASASLQGTVSDDGLPAGAAVTAAWSKVSGPGTVSFANAAAPQTTASFSAAGAYVLKLAASDTQLTGSATVTVTVNAQNQAPVVNAGANQTISLPTSAQLGGTVTDDGLPAGATVTSAWSQVSGPGTVTFANAASPATTASFSAVGTYGLRLSASDTQLSSSADVTVVVNPQNQPPQVSAGPNQTVTLPASAQLAGSATDDGQPAGGQLTVAWSQVSGPGTTTFSAPNAASTQAGFSAAGAYVLRLSAGDTQLSSASEVTVSVQPANQPPVVALTNPTSGASVTTGQTTTLTAQASDPDGTVARVEFFANAAKLGEATAAPFQYAWRPSAAGSSQLTARATDNLGAATTSAAVSVTVTQAAANGTLTILMPANGSNAQNNVRPALSACFAGNGGALRPDSFRVFLDGRDFSSEVTFERNEVMFMPQFNLEEGSHTYVVQWVSGGSVLAQDSTTFTVDSLLTDGHSTRFYGQVCSVAGTPLASVTVRCNATYQQTSTGFDGRFVLDDLPAGENALFIDPSGQLTDGLQYAPVTVAEMIVAGHLTRLDRPIYLPPVDQSKGIFVTSYSPTEQIITSPDLPGVKVMIPPNTEIRFPNGASSGTVTMIKIPGDRTPACYGAGTRFPYLISLQPENTALSQPAQLSTPNDLDLPNGARAAFYSLNKESGRFGQSGTATVVGDKLVTDEGSGLTTFDWHINDPAPPRILETNGDNKAAQATEIKVCSTMDERSGELMEDHTIPSYYSLGAARSVGLHYSSTSAVPEMLFSSWVYKKSNDVVPPLASTSVSGSLGSGRNFFNASQLDPRFDYDDRFFATTKFDASAGRSGRQIVDVRTTNHFGAGGLNTELSATTPTSVSLINGSKLYPANGKGWSVTNVDRLIDHDRFKDGTTDVYGNQLVTGADIIRGDGKIDSFGRRTTVARVANANLSFELGSTAGYDSVGNVLVVPELGFVRPPEGESMLMMRVDASNPSQTSELFLPVSKLANNVAVIQAELDFLTNDVNINGSKASLVAQVEYRYSTTRTQEYGSGTDGYNQWDRVVHENLSYNNAIQGGADTGFARRSGFRPVRIVLPADAVGKPGYLHIVLVAQAFDPTSYSTVQASSALLIDRLRFQSRSVVGTTERYTAAPGDFSALEYIGSSQTYERTSKDGSVQVFDALGRQTESRDRNGNRTLYTYTDGDGDGQSFELASVTDPVGLITNLTYKDGKLAAIVDPTGRTTSLLYSGPQLTQIVNPDGSTRTFGYNAQGRLSSQSDALGQRRQYFYGPSGRLIKVIRADGASYFYQPQLGRALDDAGVVGSSDAPAALIREKATIMTDARGAKSSRTLNAAGQVMSQTNALSQQTLLDYTWDRRLREVTQSNGNRVIFDFDESGNLIFTRNLFNGAVTSISYEPLYNLPSRVSDALSHSTDIGYDLFGNATSVTDAKGQRSTLTYNAAGQVLSSTDPLGHTATLTYNARGLPDSVTDTLGRKTTFTYDAAGNALTATDPAGRVTSTQFDPMGRPAQVTAADGGVTSYGYDPNGDLLTLTDPNGHVRSWSYDARRRPQTLTDALGRVSTLNYDAQGNLKNRTRRDGAVIGYQYDALNRASQVSLPALPNGVPADTVSFGYDEVGNVTSVADADGAVTNAYDPLSRLTRTTQTFGGQAQALGYAYDLLNRRAQMSDGAGTTTYAYDELNRLTGLTDPAGRAFAFGFDAASRPASLGYPNGVAATMSFDAAGQLLSLVHGKGSAALASVVYAYNPTGTRASEAREDGNTRSFGYDAADRVLSSVNSALPTSRNEAFSYDEEGNRTDSARLHDAADELTEDATYTYAYDAEGNLVSRTSKSDPAKVTSYAYDALNRLVQVRTAGGGTVTYAYDPMGRRVAKNNNGATTRYVLDGWNVRLELDASTSNLLAANTHAGLDRLLVRDPSR